LGRAERIARSIAGRELQRQFLQDRHGRASRRSRAAPRALLHRPDDAPREVDVRDAQADDFRRTEPDERPERDLRPQVIGDRLVQAGMHAAHGGCGRADVGVPLELLCVSTADDGVGWACLAKRANGSLAIPGGRRTTDM
jgi:hypothetical protein